MSRQRIVLTVIFSIICTVGVSAVFRMASDTHALLEQQRLSYELALKQHVAELQTFQTEMQIYQRLVAMTVTSAK